MTADEASQLCKSVDPHAVMTRHVLLSNWWFMCHHTSSDVMGVRRLSTASGRSAIKSLKT